MPLFDINCVHMPTHQAAQNVRHSLGGGIAKLVALQIPIASRPLAIAFASPGVQYAARVLFGHESQDGPIHTRLSGFDGELNVSVFHGVLEDSWGIMAGF